MAEIDQEAESLSRTLRELRNDQQSKQREYISMVETQLQQRVTTMEEHVDRFMGKLKKIDADRENTAKREVQLKAQVHTLKRQRSEEGKASQRREDDLKRELDALRNERCQQVERLETHLKQTQEQLSEGRLKGTREIAALKASEQHLKDQLQQASVDARDLKDELKRRRQEYQDKERIIREGHKFELEQQQQKNRADMLAHHKNHENDMRDVREECNASIRDKESVCNDRIRGQEEENERLRSELSAIRQTLDAATEEKEWEVRRVRGSRVSSFSIAGATARPVLKKITSR